MPVVNFDQTPEMDDFSPVPAGTYLCRVGSVVIANNKGPLMTKSGEAMWELNLVVLQPPDLEGKKIRDLVVFSADPKSNSAKRLKFICHRFGINKDNQPGFDLQPQHFEGKVARVKVTVDESEYDKTNDDGTVTKKKRNRNQVAFDGYEAVTDAEEKKAELPF